MKTVMIKLAKEGLNKALGFAPKCEDIVLLEGSVDYVRFYVNGHSDIEWSVTRRLDEKITVEMENMEDGTTVDFY